MLERAISFQQKGFKRLSEQTKENFLKKKNIKSKGVKKTSKQINRIEKKTSTNRFALTSKLVEISLPKPPAFTMQY